MKIETTYPDGTRARYKLQDGSSVPLQLSALKPIKRPRSKADKRLFPKTSYSTADYVRQYFALNTKSAPGHPHAYAAHLDHTTLYAPLNEARSAVYTGIDTVETVEDPLP